MKFWWGKNGIAIWPQLQREGIQCVSPMQYVAPLCRRNSWRAETPPPPLSSLPPFLVVFFICTRPHRHSSPFGLSTLNLHRAVFVSFPLFSTFLLVSLPFPPFSLTSCFFFIFLVFTVISHHLDCLPSFFVSFPLSSTLFLVSFPSPPFSLTSWCFLRSFVSSFLPLLPLLQHHIISGRQGVEVPKRASRLHSAIRGGRARGVPNKAGGFGAQPYRGPQDWSVTHATS